MPCMEPMHSFHLVLGEGIRASCIFIGTDKSEASSFCLIENDGEGWSDGRAPSCTSGGRTRMGGAITPCCRAALIEGIKGMELDRLGGGVSVVWGTTEMPAVPINY